MKKFDPQLDPDDVEAQYKRHKDLQKAGYYEDNKTKSERASIQDFLDKRSPESKAAAEQRMQEYKEGRAKSMEQFNANMQKISEDHDAKMKELRNTTKSGGGGGAMPKSNRDITKNYKAGGKVSSASKRADGCAVKGKTKGKIV